MKISHVSFLGTLGISTLGALYACSPSDDNDDTSTAADGSTPTGDSSSTNDDASATDAMTSNESGALDSGAPVSFPDGGGLRIIDPTGTYDLTEGANAGKLGNAYKFGAASTAGGQLRAVALVLRHAVVVNDAGGSEVVTVIPGKYTCADPLMPTQASPSFNAGIQYSAAGPIYQTENIDECEVNLTTFGPVGTQSTGTFSAKIRQVGFPDAGKTQISGSFDLVRLD